ncbi:MAG: glutathione peroxidase [Candidatus Thiodiazotropha sp.]
MDSNTFMQKLPAGLTMTLVAAMWLIPFAGHAQSDTGLICNEHSSYSKRQLNSKHIDNLCETYRGKVMLVVNTASRCAFTDQYDGLEKTYSRYRDRGLVVLGFPSNDFGNQEPGSEVKIKKFCRLTYGVQFPMYAKSRVTGEDADPFYRALADAAGTPPRWNFHKYLIDRGGKLVGSYNSFVKPGSSKLIQAIEDLL